MNFDMSKAYLPKRNIREAVPGYERMTEEERRQWAIRQLQSKAAELGHPPRKADCEETVKICIKAALGPWPRALEAAGLKEPRQKPPRRQG